MNYIKKLLLTVALLSIHNSYSSQNPSVDSFYNYDDLLIKQLWIFLIGATIRKELSAQSAWCIYDLQNKKGSFAVSLLTTYMTYKTTNYFLTSVPVNGVRLMFNWPILTDQKAKEYSQAITGLSVFYYILKSTNLFKSLR